MQGERKPSRRFSRMPLTAKVAHQGPSMIPLHNNCWSAGQAPSDDKALGCHTQRSCSTCRCKRWLSRFVGGFCKILHARIWLNWTFDTGSLGRLHLRLDLFCLRLQLLKGIESVLKPSLIFSDALAIDAPLPNPLRRRGSRWSSLCPRQVVIAPTGHWPG